MNEPGPPTVRAAVAKTRTEDLLRGRLERPPSSLNWARLPTPVERLTWLQSPSRDVEVWVKRDDQTSELYGGGKVRKLEWIFANPPFDEQRPVVSVGGIGSHHLVALALFLHRLGRRLHALTFDQVPTEHVCNNLATLASVGTEFWHVRGRLAIPWAWMRYRLLQSPAERGRLMTPGASTPLGCLGFVAAAFELVEQIEAGLMPAPKTIYLTAGTAGTAAGLALGLSLANLPVHLRLVSSVERLAFNRFMFLAKLREVHGELIRRGLRGDAHTGGVSRLLRNAGVSWSIDARRVGPGYGVPTAECIRAVDLASEHGLQLETTYTGKCMAALLDDLATNDGTTRPSSPILLWNTHGGNDLTPWIEPGWQQYLPRCLRGRCSAELAPRSTGE